MGLLPTVHGLRLLCSRLYAGASNDQMTFSTQHVHTWLSALTEIPGHQLHYYWPSISDWSLHAQIGEAWSHFVVLPEKVQFPAQRMVTLSQSGARHRTVQLLRSTTPFCHAAARSSEDLQVVEAASWDGARIGAQRDDAMASNLALHLLLKSPIPSSYRIDD